MLLIALAACHSPARRHYPQIEKLAWLEGRWRIGLPMDETMQWEPEYIIETWRRPADSVLSATSWYYGQADSLPAVQIFLEQRGNKISYNTAPLRGQSNPRLGNANRYIMARSISYRHDDANRVHYLPYNRDSVLVEVTSPTAGGWRTFNFLMRRIR